MFKWNSTLYSKFLKERTQPSIDLVNRIDLENVSTAFDLGCGPGNSSRVLKDRFPNAKVIGADNSEEMIKTATEKNPDIEFINFDATKDFANHNQKYDVVFSNACIQWIPDNATLLKNMMSLVNKNGVMAGQVPVNADEPIHRILTSLAKSEKWKNYITEQRHFYYLSESEYFDVISDLSSDFEMWKTIYFHRMPSYQSILEWYRGTGMRPYLAQLTEEQKTEFENDFLSELPKYYPTQKNGEIIFRFPRLFFVVKGS